MKKMVFICCFFLIATSVFAKKLEISFWHSLGFHAKKIIDEMTDEYNRTHPGVVVKDVFQGGFDEMHMKMLSAAVTRQLPDVAQVQFEFIEAFISNGFIKPINDEIPEKERNDILHVLWELVTRKGQVYGVPFCISTDVFFYNEDAFIAAGLDPGKPPATWEEMIEIGKKLTSDTDGDGAPNSYALMIWLYGFYGLAPVLWANGGQLFSDDGRRVILTSKPMIKTISMIHDLVFKYRIMPQKWTDWESGQAFLTGKLAMGWFYSSGITFGERNFPWKLRVAPMPMINNKRYAGLVGSALLNFSKGRARRRAANDFMFWLTNKENTIAFHQNIGYVPVRKSALNSLELKAFDRANPNYKVPIDMLEYGRPLPNHPEFQKINQLLRDMLQRIMLGEANMFDELKRTEREINEILTF